MMRIKWSAAVVLVIGLLVLSGCQLGNTMAGENMNKEQITILMYHHYDENEKNANSVTMTSERFREQLTALKEEGYQSIKEIDLYNYYYKDGELPEKPVLITIDDGYLSNYELAYPILEELDFYATIYVVTDQRGKTPGVTPHFSWEVAKEMYESGRIDIQSHTANAHHYIEGKKNEGPFLTTQLVGESKEEYRERIREDLLRSKETIEEHVGNQVYSLTYPYGAVNSDVVEIAKDVGFELMYTVRKDINTKLTDRYELNRINADGLFSGKDLIEEIQKYKD